MTTTGTATVQCDVAVPALTLTLSTGGAGSFNRTMSSSGHKLSYNVFTDYAHTTVWGDGTSGTSVISYSQSGTAKSATIPFYGVVLAGQAPYAGTYTDSPVVAVVY